MKTNKFDSVTLLIGTFISAFCFLASPMLLRTLVDGILITEDLRAITISMIAITVCELVLIFENGLLKYDLDKMQKDFVLKSQHLFLERIFSGEINPNKNEIERFWFTDLMRVSYVNVRQRWARIKDVFLFIILGFAAISLDSTAGVFLLGFMLLQIVSGIVFNYKWGSLNASTRSIIEKEEETVATLSDQYPNWIDKGLDSIKQNNLKSVFTEIKNKQFKLDRFRSLTDDVLRSFRTVVIIGILWLALRSVSDGGSVGSIWALIMVAYRLIGPAASLSKWGLEEKRSEACLERFNRWLYIKNSVKSEPSASYSKIKNCLQIIAENKTNTFILLNTNQIELFLESARIWRDRVKNRFHLYIFDKNYTKSDLDAVPTDTFPRIVLLSNLSTSGLYFENIREEYILSRLQYPSVIWIILDQLNWMHLNQDFKQLYYSNSTETFQALPVYSAEAEINTDFLKITSELWKNKKLKLDEFNRDLHRYYRMKTKFSIGYIPSISKERSLEFEKKLRNYDYLIEIPMGGILIFLPNCTVDSARKITERAFGVDAIKYMYDLEWIEFNGNSNKDENQIREIELFVIDKMLGSALYAKKVKEVAA